MLSVFAYSLCLSSLIVISSIIPLTIGRIKAGYSFKNMSTPRAFFDELPEFGKRAVWCHQNCWESLSLHAPACLLCLISQPNSNISIIAAISHPIIRILYIVAYILDIPLARSLFWAAGILTTVTLYAEGLFKII